MDHALLTSHLLFFPPPLPPLSPSFLLALPFLCPHLSFLFQLPNILLLSFLLLLFTCLLHLYPQSHFVCCHHHLHEAHQDRCSLQGPLPFQLSKLFIDSVPCRSPQTFPSGFLVTAYGRGKEGTCKTKRATPSSWNYQAHFPDMVTLDQSLNTLRE